MPGIFTISLDFELHWGGFEKWPLSKDKFGYTIPHPATEFLPTEQGSYNAYFINTRKVIPRMLDLFSNADAHVTWATVGMLFTRDRDELLKHSPSLKPQYHERQLSAYEYIDQTGVGDDERSDPYHYAASLISAISRTNGQEIGTHTFAHYYCNEPGQSMDQFREDIKAAQRVARAYGLSLISLVFPRNQFNDQYLRVCYEEGIRIVRSNPMDWFWKIDSTQHESMWKRLNRGLDAYFPIGHQNTYKPEGLFHFEGLPMCLPASRLLRPYNPKEGLLNKFKISRIKKEMTRAAVNGEVYHLWWHPHNFGRYPVESLEGLKQILDHFAECRHRYGMISMSMGEIAKMHEIRN